MIGLVREGLSITAIERFIQGQRRASAANVASQVMSVLSISQVECKALSLINSPYPSNDIIGKCFISEFLMNEHKYTSVMSRITTTGMISFDHTFKVAANIGYLRSDGKWVTQYNSVFIVMNQAGQVMGWQFTKSTAMDEVKELLISVLHRVEDTHWLF